MTEKQIEASILDFLNRFPNTFAFKVNTVGIYDPTKKIFRRTSKFVVRGTHDIIGVIKGRFFSIEVKTEKGLLSFLRQKKPSEIAQAEFLHQILKCGGESVVVSSLEDAIEFIRRLNEIS